MLSKTKIKWINSLERKKNRDEEGLFVAEGAKIVADLLPSLKCRFLAVLQNEYNDEFRHSVDEIEVVSSEEYNKITLQKSPQGVLAVFEKPEYKINISDVLPNLNLALSDIQDPGNLGTIIRLADWFGIKDVFCSLHTADAFGSKTVQATMGAIGRVRVHYVDLAVFLKGVKSKMPIYGTFMNGKNIYNENLPENGIIVMGNEGSGISDEILPFISEKLMIPSFPENTATSESLNVGIATAIVISEFRRRNILQL